MPSCNRIVSAVCGAAQMIAALTLPIALMNAYNRMAISFRAKPMALAA